MAATRDDDDIAVHVRRGAVRVLDRDDALFEIHHQPLFDERVDAEKAVGAQIRVLEHGKFEIPDLALAKFQFGYEDAIDHAGIGDAVQRHRGSRRQPQRMRGAHAKRRGVGAAVDDEMERPAAIDIHRDRHSRFHLAGGDIVAADRERVVDHRGRQIGEPRRWFRALLQSVGRGRFGMKCGNRKTRRLPRQRLGCARW